MSPKAAFPEIRIRLAPGEVYLKKAWEEAADRAKPRPLSLNQWLIAVATAAAEAQGITVEKKRSYR